ncbi:MAG: STAS domain-containing protein [Nocardioides sp.]
MSCTPLAPELHVTTLVAENELLVVLRGEADLTNHLDLRSSLAEVELTGADAVHLELSGLAFCDLEAFRQLLAFAIHVRSTGRQVCVHGASSTIKKVAHFLQASDVMDCV